MSRRSRSRACVLALVIGGAAWFSGTAAADNLVDPPGDFFPGKYYEYKAQFYLQRKQYRAALNMFQLSGFWADKMSQYNAGVMLFNGIGMRPDKVRGAAWFRIAAQSKDEIPVAALKIAMAELDDEQRAQSDLLFRELAAKYGDEVTLPRAIDRFYRDKADVTGHGLPDPNLKISEVGSLNLQVTGAAFLRGKNAELDDLVRQITGTVKVGTIRTLEVSPEARKDAASNVLDAGAGSTNVPDEH